MAGGLELPRPRAILAHYAEDVEARSPLIARLAGEASGTLRGKPALRCYFAQGLARAPELRFEPIAPFTGVDGLCLLYAGAGGVQVAEAFRLDGAGAGRPGRRPLRRRRRGAALSRSPFI